MNKEQKGEKEEGKAGGNVGKKESDAAKEGKVSGAKSPKQVTTNNYTNVIQSGANINITNINNHHTYVIYR